MKCTPYYLATAAFVCCLCTGIVQAFVHPGCLSTQADLDRMATKVDANEQPWKGGWDILVGNTGGYLDDAPLAQPTIYVGGGYTENYIRLAMDCAKAYQCALRYNISGETAYGNKAVEIMNAWASTHTGWAGDSNCQLRAGIYGYEFACAAELMRNYSGWIPTDFASFQTYMVNLFFGPNADAAQWYGNKYFLTNHNGTCDSHYWANWDLAAMASSMAIGVLADRLDIFDFGLNYFYNGVGSGNIDNAVHHIFPDGTAQWQETGRDQGHATMGVPLMGTICEIAWNQGVDLYSYEENKFLAGCEYIAKYNLWYDVPYVTYVNCDYIIQTNIGSSGRGSERPGWDMIYNHYVNQMGIACPYSQQFAEMIRPDGGGFNYGTTSGGFDQLGFTTLTHSLDPIASGAVPSALVPYIKGSQITLSWAGSAYADSYNVKRSTTSGGPYTTLATITELYYIDPGLTNGTTYYYVVSANNPGGESADSIEVSAAVDGQLYGTVIGTDGSFNNAGLRKENVFDGSLRNYFDAPTGVAWAGLDLGSGVSAVIMKVKYCPRPGYGSRMVGGKFQGSNTVDFSSGVIDLYTIASAPPDNVLTSQTISNGDSFRYVRYICPENGWGNAAELQFHGNVSGLNAPPPPSGLTATSGDGEINLTWNPVSDAANYKIKRALTSGGPYLIVANMTGTSFTETGLPAGTYYYVVSAVNSAGESANSGQASAQVIENVALGCTASASDDGTGWNPAEVAASAFDGDIYTKWYTGGDTGSSGWLQADLGAGNEAAVIRYDISSANDVPERDPKDWQLLASNDGSNWTILDTRSGEVFAARYQTNQYSISNSTAYRYYRLNILSNFSGSAADGIQLSELALMAQGGGTTPPDSTPPAPPAGLAATAGSAIVTLDWADNTDGDLASYNVYRSTTSGSYGTALATGITVSGYTDNTVTNGTMYYYVVTAIDTSSNESGSSNEVLAMPQAVSEPDMYVNDIAMGLSKAGRNYFGQATVSIKDNTAANVEGATVYGTWSGAVSENASGVTDSNGTVFFQTINKAKSGTFTFTVTNVVKSGYVYNDALNGETSDSISTP